MNDNQSSVSIIIQAFILVFISHLTLTTYTWVNNFTILIGIILSFFFLYYVIIYKKKYFNFFLIIYICCHFGTFLPGAGGLYNILAFGFLLIFSVNFKKYSDYKTDQISFILILILILFTIL